MLTASNEGMPGSDEGQRKKEANRLMKLFKRKIRSAKSQSTSPLIKARVSLSRWSERREGLLVPRRLFGG